MISEEPLLIDIYIRVGYLLGFNKIKSDVLYS